MSGVSETDTSDCEANDTYGFDVHLVTCRDHTSSDCVSDRNVSIHLLEELRDCVEVEQGRGERIPLVFDRATLVRKGCRSLKELLERTAPVPIESDVAASILRGVVEGLLFLHRRHLAHGYLSPEVVFYDDQLNGFLLIEHYPRDGKPTDERAPLAEDMFHVGEMMFALLTGELPKFGEDNHLLPPREGLPIKDDNGLKLAARLLSAFSKFRNTAGSVFYSAWMQQKLSRCRVRIL